MPDLFSARIYKEKEYEGGKLIAVHDVIKRDSIRRANRDTTKKIDGREPEFVGGRASWREYLEKNFRYPERARKSDKEAGHLSITINLSISFENSEMRVNFGV